MKNYICLFLIFLSFNLYAPNFSKDYINKQVKESENQYKLELVSYQKDSKMDDKDLSFIKKYHMTKYFGIKERKELRKVSKELGIKPEWLYKTIFIECQGDIYKSNPYSGAIGTIQFLPSTARLLGTDTSKIKQMTTCQQLQLTKKYIQIVSNGRKIISLHQLYLLVFFPQAAYQSESYIIGDNHTNVFKYNKILCDKADTTLTVSHIKRFLDRIFTI